MNLKKLPKKLLLKDGTMFDPYLDKLSKISYYSWIL